MFDASFDSPAPPASLLTTANRCSVASAAERTETARALRAGLDWLLALQRRVARGQEASAVRARDVAIEIAAVTRELVALGADPAGAEALAAGIGFVPSS